MALGDKVVTVDTYDRQTYEEFLNELLEKSPLVGKDKLKSLFLVTPKLTVSAYSKILTIEASESWNQYKSNNRNLFVSLFQRLYSAVNVYGVKQAELLFSKELNIVVDTLGKNYDDMLSLLINLEYHIKNKNDNQALEAREDLHEICRRFNIIYKDKFIKNYVNGGLEKIQDKFSLSENYKKTSITYVDVNQFAEIFIAIPQWVNNAKNIIEQNFNKTFNDEDVKDIVLYILYDNDPEAYEKLGFNIPSFYDSVEKKKAIKRLRNNYSRTFNKEIDKSLSDILVTYLNDPANNFELKANFTRDQQRLIEEVLVLMRESSSSALYENDYLFESEYNDLTPDEKNELEEFETQKKLYLQLKRLVYQYYKQQNMIVEESVEHVSNENVDFNDFNYKITDISYIFNKQFIEYFLKNVDVNKWECIVNNDYFYFALKKLMVDDGLLAVILNKDFKSIQFADIINAFPKLMISIDNSKISINNVENIIKRCRLYRYSKESEIQFLSVEVLSKIINNNQFLSDKMSNKDIRQRVEKAADLMVKAENKDTSAVPYGCDVTVDDVSVIRYLNNDPYILISGIDTNTCFKLSSNDNDFVFYTILNKNGFVIKFTDEQGNLLGRASGIRRANVIEINSIRSYDNNNTAFSQDDYILYDNMLRAFETYAKKLIDTTTNSDLPIDFVVCNKAGVLECSSFDQRYNILNSHLFNSPIDVYHEDWEEFAHTYDGYKESYFQQINVSDQESFTTDFGHYPVVLISSRPGKILERLSDISYNSPDAIYKRPKGNKVFVTGDEISSVVIDNIKKINAFKSVECNNINYLQHNIDPNKISSIVLTDCWYCILYKDGIVSYNCKSDKEEDLFEMRQAILETQEYALDSAEIGGKR